ncbi:hypothetical protein B0H66DRAFT_604359 [Apodospora peruviana]|uniref:Uncharacterized protein n=1 Tax=Apodospora peruviana TaxID=516989 RepID=A0AAE0I041_9PEZI|nr:hypothetical protein B0H66DRAFT_604359 [Apodospora peruviana]
MLDTGGIAGLVTFGFVVFMAFAYVGARIFARHLDGVASKEQYERERRAAHEQRRKERKAWQNECELQRSVDRQQREAARWVEIDLEAGDGGHFHGIPDMTQKVDWRRVHPALRPPAAAAYIPNHRYV